MTARCMSGDCDEFATHEVYLPEGEPAAWYPYCAEDAMSFGPTYQVRELDEFTKALGASVAIPIEGEPGSLEYWANAMRIYRERHNPREAVFVTLPPLLVEEAATAYRAFHLLLETTDLSLSRDERSRLNSLRTAYAEAIAPYYPHRREPT